MQGISENQIQTQPFVETEKKGGKKKEEEAGWGKYKTKYE